MKTSDKCPHCGAEIEYWAGAEAYWSTCGSTAKKQADLCKERAAHGHPADEPSHNGSTHARLNWWKDRADSVSDELAATKRELEEMTQKFSDAENRVIGGGYAAQMLRRHCGLDDTKEDLMEVAEAFLKLQARVRELEGLRVLSRDIGTITLLLDQDLSTVPPLTLGEAMQRKEGV